MRLPLYGMIRNNNGMIELYEIKSIRINEDKITTYNQVADIFIKQFKMNSLATESVYVLCLMYDGTPIGVGEVAKGSSKHADAPINVIGKFLLLTGADSFVVLHNHPNNSCKESEDDRVFTNKLIELSRFLDIDFEDHMIISRTDWTTLIHKKRV